MNTNYFPKLFKQLSYEFNCTPEDFTKSENVLTLSEYNEKTRAYSPIPNKKPFFHMVTTGGNAVITADERLHPFLKEFMTKTGHYLFELPNLLPLEKELNKYGHTLSQTYHMFLPSADAQPLLDLPVKWFHDEEIHRFYGDQRFPNAICDKYNPRRPDRIVVCAYDGDIIMGMAGCSEDAKGWLQIGIDVMPEYRSQGVGTYLVTLLKNEILRHGDVPFYGTSLSGYHSWNIAINCGFRPAWVEIEAVNRKNNQKK